MLKSKSAPQFDVRNVPKEAERLLQSVTDPFQRSLLNNFRRHAMLEVAGRWPEILEQELTVPEPLYKIVDGSATHVFDGHDAVSGFYRDMTAAGLNVLCPIEEHMAVSGWGIWIESLLGHVIPGDKLHILGVDPAGYDLERTYFMTERVANIWPYTREGKLIGEHVYLDPNSRQVYELAPSEIVTPADAAAVLNPLLAAPYDPHV